MADIFDKCTRFRERQRTVRGEDLALAEQIIFDVSPVDNAGPWMECRGQRMLQVSTNDYLGLSVHPQVIAAAADVVREHGISAPMGARPLTGTTELHLELERKVAEFKRSEASVTFSTGANAMIGSIAALAGAQDLLILDQFAHASLVCGARTSGAQIKYFDHNDPDNLEKVLTNSDDDRAIMVVVDGVYSMQGDIGPLAALCDLRDKYGFRLIVDDAHGTGVFGAGGRGVAELLEVEERLDLHLGTFSKAVGTYGGFAAGAEDVIKFIKYTAPTMLFTKAVPAAVAAATLVSLDLIRDSQPLRRRLWENTATLQDGLRRRGFDIGATESPITPVHFNDMTGLHLSHRLREKYRIWGSAVLFPAVRLGTSILRIIPTARHTAEDIHYLLTSLEAARAELDEERSVKAPKAAEA